MRVVFDYDSILINWRVFYDLKFKKDYNDCSIIDSNSYKIRYSNIPNNKSTNFIVKHYKEYVTSPIDEGYLELIQHLLILGHSVVILVKKPINSNSVPDDCYDYIDSINSNLDTFGLRGLVMTEFDGLDNIDIYVPNIRVYLLGTELYNTTNITIVSNESSHKGHAIFYNTIEELVDILDVVSGGAL